MKQIANFGLFDKTGKTELNSIFCSVEWSEDGKDLNVDFFDRNTGYSGRSSAFGTFGNWSYQSPIENLVLRSLCHAVDQWEDWLEFLSWSDESEETLYLRLSDDLPDNPDDYEYLEVERL